MATQWNFRLIEFGEGDTKHVAVHEVYYADGIPRAYGERGAWLGGSDADEVQGIHAMIAGAFFKPVLKESDFEEGKVG